MSPPRHVELRALPKCSAYFSLYMMHLTETSMLKSLLITTLRPLFLLFAQICDVSSKLPRPDQILRLLATARVKLSRSCSELHHELKEFKVLQRTSLWDMGREKPEHSLTQQFIYLVAAFLALWNGTWGQ